MPNAGEFDAVLQYLKNKLPQLGFFSTLDEAIRAAPFEKAPAQQWQNYLKPGLAITRNGHQFPLKAEELRYSGLPELLNAFGPTGTDEARNNLASVLHNPIDPTDMRLSKDVLLEHLHRNRPNFNIYARMQGANTPKALRARLPELDLLDRPQTETGGSRIAPQFGDASYPNLAHVPGVPNSYEENITTSPDFGTFPSHFSPRDLSWSRTTRHYLDPVTQAGGSAYLSDAEKANSPTARLVEEIQSDRHQAAAEKIRQLPEEILSHLTPSERASLQGDQLFLNRPGIKENTVKVRRGYRTPEEDSQYGWGEQRMPQGIAEKPPDTPFKDPGDYGLLELKKQLLNSIHQGDRYLALIDPQSQIDRYGTEEGRDAGMQHVYGTVYPAALKKLARLYGADVTNLSIPIRVPEEARRANALVEAGVDTPSELIQKSYADEWNSDSIHDLIQEMLPEARRQGYDSELMKHLNVAQDALGDLDTHAAIPDEYALHGDEPYLRTLERLDDALTNAHNHYIDTLGPSANNIQTKTFPALEITPELAQKVQSTGVPFFKKGGEAAMRFDGGGSVDGSGQEQQLLSPQSEIPGIPEGEMMIWQNMPPAMQQEMRLSMIKNLYQPAMQMPAYGEGGAVEDVGEEIDKYLDEIANEHAARAIEAAAKAPEAARPPLPQFTEDPLYHEATRIAKPMPLKGPLAEGFLTKRQAFADGGDVHSALNWLKRSIERTKNLGYYGTHIPLPGLDLIRMSPKGEARVAVRAAQQLYGVDKHGNPVFLGGILHSGATPPGIIDEALSTPDSMAGFEEMLMKITPGPNGNQHDLIHALDPAWSRNASARLDRLNQAVASDTGIGAPQGFGEDLEDLAGRIGPLMAASRLAEEGTMARKALEQLAGGAGTGSRGSAPQRPKTPPWINEDVGQNPVADAAFSNSQR
jgi:hypothetical protein